MRVPIRWLKEYVDIALATDELADRITMAGLEVAAIERYPDKPLDWQGIEVGEVTGVEPHPNADKLVIARVRVSAGEFQSVTGAPNITIGSSGMRVPVALEGAQIINAYDDKTETIEVRSAELRGSSSQVVICSEKELGLSDNHSGVLFLDDDMPVGTPLIELLGDEVLDIELTPNLGRCLSVIGVAREVAALTGAPLKISQPKWNPQGEPIGGKVEVSIEDPDLCPRYSVALIENVTTKPAPFWMRYRLMLAGMRPISNIVDITNYVMLEWGQPLHAFDYDSLRNRLDGATPHVIIRRAHEGEVLTTLDNVKRDLEPDMLMIADPKGSIALAGVMGGLETEIEDQTENILLESASFHAINNRRTSSRLNLPSEASHRFSRGVPAAYAELAAKRASQLMQDLASGTVASGLVDDFPKPPEEIRIDLPIGEPERLLGIPVSVDQICKTLQSLDFETEVKGDICRVKVPHYRLDVEIPADLVEEIGRVIGYEKLPSTRLEDSLPRQERNRALEWEEEVRDLLCGMGLTEVINYSLTNPSSVAKLNPTGNYDLGNYVELENYISVERTHMRKTLLNLILETVESNQKHENHIAIYEIGRVFWPNATNEYGLPDEPRHLALALAGNRNAVSWTEPESPVDFFDMKGIIEHLLRVLGINDVHFTQSEHPTYHPGRSTSVLIGDELIGSFGEVHPLVTKNFDLTGQIYAAELNLEVITEQAGIVSTYIPVPRYPSVRQDLAILLDEEHSAQEIERVIHSEGAPLLEKIELFDLYTGEQVPNGKKSLAYALTYRSDERTLTDQEVHEVHQKIQTALEHKLNAQIRGVAA